MATNDNTNPIGNANDTNVVSINRKNKRKSGNIQGEVRYSEQFLQLKFDYIDSRTMAAVPGEVRDVYEVIRRYIRREIEGCHLDVVPFLEHNILVAKVTHETICEVLDYSNDTSVSNHLKYLTDILGWIPTVKTKKKRGANIYILGTFDIDPETNCRNEDLLMNEWVRLSMEVSNKTELSPIETCTFLMGMEYKQQDLHKRGRRTKVFNGNPEGKKVLEIKFKIDLSFLDTTLYQFLPA